MYSLCYRYSGCVVAVPPGRMWALAGRERRVEPAAVVEGAVVGTRLRSCKQSSYR